jgi:D-xylulose reductase
LFGQLRKYISHPLDFLYPLPSHISLSEGVLLEPLAVAVHACRLADIKLGHDVLVFGAGTVGLLCAAVAKAMGAQKVVSLDINASRLSFAQSYTSTSTYLPPRASTADSISSAVKSLHFPAGGADIILEATGQEICIDTGIQVCKPGGTFVQVGLGKEKVVFPIVGLGEKEITMRGSFRYGAVDFEMAMGLVREGRIGLTGLVTGVVPFEETTEAWERTAKGEGIKTVIKVGDF